MNLRCKLMVGVSIIGLSLAGCEKRVVVSDMQGTWVAQKASQREWVKEATVCQMVLLGDGTFTASVPDYLMMTFDKASGGVISGKGRWRVEPSVALAPSQIKLVFDEVDGRRVNWGSARLNADRGATGVEWFFWVSEEGGERFVFERPLQTVGKPSGAKAPVGDTPTQ